MENSKTHKEPKVLHFHDCADVGKALVKAAAKQNLNWGYLSADTVRPPNKPKNKWAGRAFTLGVMMNNYRHIKKAEVLHIHYAMVVPEAQLKPMPQRPYLLHLHGTDIRKHWAGGRRNSKVQPWIDAAAHVYYTNLDTRENAEEARPDAEYMPAFINPDSLVPWVGENNSKPIIRFASRWDAIKGADAQLELVEKLKSALPEVSLEGIDWGEKKAAAAASGVKLTPKMNHQEYINWLAGASIVIGQAQPMLGVSEFEAMAMGIPLAVLGERIARPEDNTTPPALEGSADEVIDQLKQAINDPKATSEKLGGKEWVFEHHLADKYIPQLQAKYRALV